MKRPYIEFINNEGIKYKIFFRKIKKKDLEGVKAKDIYGFTTAPDSKQPKIVIDSSLKNKKKLEILIHETSSCFFMGQKRKRNKKNS